MEFNEYQKKSRQTAVYPVIGHKCVYPALGLAGESGEVLNKVKKLFRDKQGEINDEQRQAIGSELGDVLWYLAQLATEFDLDLSQVAQDNLDKLLSRQQRGQLHGNGDER